MCAFLQAIDISKEMFGKKHILFPHTPSRPDNVRRSDQSYSVFY
jgi:hypothetical protein